MQSLVRSSACLFVAATTALSALAAPLSFDFKDPKGVNNIQFSLDAPLEAISGSGNGIIGTIAFDPAAPAATTGKIVLATASITVGNPMMKEHIGGGMWLDTAKYPEITFEAVSLSNVRTTGDKTEADVAGKLTVKDVTRDVKVPVSFTYLPGKLGARIGKPDVKGDLLVVRANFSINRSDYNINAGKATDKVAETIQLSLSVAGAAPQG